MTRFVAFFEIYKSSDLQVFKNAGIITGLQHIDLQQKVTFFKNMRAFWGDFALVDNLDKASWKISDKQSYFQKNYASSKVKELKACYK